VKSRNGWNEIPQVSVERIASGGLSPDERPILGAGGAAATLERDAGFYPGRVVDAAPVGVHGPFTGPGADVLPQPSRALSRVPVHDLLRRLRERRHTGDGHRENSRDDAEADRELLHGALLAGGMGPAQVNPA